MGASVPQWGLPMWLSGKESTCQEIHHAGDTGDMGLILGLELAAHSSILA